jgi:hypothetical protein
VSPFGFGLGTTHFKGDTPFFSSLKIHTIDFTLPSIQMVAQVFKLCKRMLSRATIKNYLMIATWY